MKKLIEEVTRVDIALRIKRLEQELEMLKTSTKFIANRQEDIEVLEYEIKLLNKMYEETREKSK